MQLCDPEVAYVPAVHSLQEVALGSELIFPPGQSVQEFACPIKESEYFPGIQLKQDTDDGMLYSPRSQGMQVVDRLLVAKVPASQLLQFTSEASLDEELNFPLWQSLHLVEPLESVYFPLEQSSH